MIDQELTEKILSINQPMTQLNPTRFSTISLLLKAGRSLSGRNLDTGVYEHRELNEQNFMNGTYHSNQFAGLINYLIFLEQLGSVFKPADQQDRGKENPITQVLNYFTNLDSDRVESIVSLRNCMAHKFGLATEKKPKRNVPRKFTLSIARNSAIIGLPMVPWNGNFQDKSEDSSTLVYIHDLIAMIESIYRDILEENKKNNIEMKLEDGTAELYARYTMIY